MREMEKLCSRVRLEDIQILQRMINPVKEEASFAIKEFLQLHSESAEELKKQFNEQEDTTVKPPLTRSTTVGGGSIISFLYVFNLVCICVCIYISMYKNMFPEFSYQIL